MNIYLLKANCIGHFKGIKNMRQILIEIVNTSFSSCFQTSIFTEHVFAVHLTFQNDLVAFVEGRQEPSPPSELKGTEPLRSSGKQE